MDFGKVKEMIQKLKQVGGDTDDSDSGDAEQTKKKSDVEKVFATLRQLYVFSKVRIFNVADHIAASEVTGDTPISEHYSTVETPVADTWDFRIGDIVRIKYPYRDFKKIQSSTIGWNAKLSTIHDVDSVVTGRWSCYDHVIAIYTPSTFATSRLYAGLLNRTTQGAINQDFTVERQWKVDEYVMLTKDLAVVEIMQERLDIIPRRYLGRRGRIVAITKTAVIVTFNERTSFCVNSHLLMKSNDQSPLSVETGSHDDFAIGETVVVISDIKTLVKNQNGYGGWNECMANLAGKTARIIHICKDRRLRVQHQLGLSWEINPKSVYSLRNPAMNQQTSNDCNFMPGDVVKVKIPAKWKRLFKKQKIPYSFLSYLESTAEIKGIDTDLCYQIAYNAGQVVPVHESNIKKATGSEKSLHQRIKNDIKHMKPGSQIFLDVGPPRFVQAVLRECNAHREIVDALTSPSTFIGYAHDGKAVIQYRNGKRYKIKITYLAKPEKFDVHDPLEGMDYETAKEVQRAVERCVEMLAIRKDSIDSGVRPVQLQSFSIDPTPTIHLRVQCIGNLRRELSELLVKQFNWEITSKRCDRSVFVARELQTFRHRIRISLHFDLDFQSDCDNLESGEDEPKRNDCDTSRVESDAASVAGADSPFKNFKPPASLEGFNYLPFPSDETGATVYIPYYVSGRRKRSVVKNYQHELHKISEKSNNINVFNIGNITNLNNINN